MLPHRKHRDIGQRTEKIPRFVGAEQKNLVLIEAVTAHHHNHCRRQPYPSSYPTKSSISIIHEAYHHLQKTSIARRRVPKLSRIRSRPAKRQLNHRLLTCKACKAVQSCTFASLSPPSWKLLEKNLREKCSFNSFRINKGRKRMSLTCEGTVCSHPQEIRVSLWKM
jgi:hypothetical protein